MLKGVARFEIILPVQYTFSSLFGSGGLSSYPENAVKALFSCPGVPLFPHFRKAVNVKGPVDHKNRLVIDLDISFILEEPELIEEVIPPFLLFSVLLRHQYLFLKAVPGSGPGLVGPGKAEFYVNLRMLQKNIQRLFHKGLPGKVILIKGKSLHAVFSGVFRLSQKGFRLV